MILFQLKIYELGCFRFNILVKEKTETRRLRTMLQNGGPKSIYKLQIYLSFHELSEPLI